MDDHKWMRRAVELAGQSIAEASRQDNAPAVGAVIVKDGVEIASAFRGMCGEGCHAEYCALQGVDPAVVAGSVVYTTLEPCSRRSPSKTPCAQRLIDAKVSKVFIGLYDPNPKIYREGWKMLRDAGIETRDFPSEFRNQLTLLNNKFNGQYRESSSPSGTARFDYVLCPAFTIGAGREQIHTQWSSASTGIIHAYSAQGHIAHARYARSLDEIDDPSALDFKQEVHAVTAKNGEVVVFKSPNGETFGLVQVVEVLSRDRGDDRTELSFTYEIRGAGSNRS